MASYRKIINLQERKRKHSLRNIMKAILYILKTGCQWRIIPNELPKEMQINKAAFTPNLKLTIESCIMQAKQNLGNYKMGGPFLILKQIRANIENSNDILLLFSKRIKRPSFIDNRLIFRLGLHQHDVCSHFQKLLIFLRMIHIINHPIDGYFRLFLPYLSVIAYHSPTLVRMP